MKNLYLLAFLLNVLLIACSPKANESISAANMEGNEFVEKDIDVNITEKIATINMDSIYVNNNSAKAVLNKRFNDIKKINDIKVKNFKKDGAYYLLRKGMKDGKEILLAIELERKGLELHSAEYNMLHSTCLKKSCDNCDFTIDNNGEIEDCRCSEKKSNSNSASCEHRSFIKTVEKDF